MKGAARRGFTWRAFAVGGLYVLFLSALTPYNDYYVRNTFIAGNHFPIGQFFLFSLLILAVNPALRRIRPSAAFSAAELMVIWIMMIVASGIPSSGFLRYHLFMLTSPYYFANESNDWANLLYPHIPEWLVVSDSEAARQFYEGVGPNGRIPWELWIRPALIWIGYVLLSYLVMLCGSVMLRKQWVEHERFAFPLVKLPAEMTLEPSGGGAFNAFFRNKMTWLGCSIPMAIHLVNGVHAHIPSFPEIPMGFNPNPLFSDRPWTGLRWLHMHLYPTVIGFTYLLPLDVSLSFWLFYLVYKAQSVASIAFGLNVSGWTMANRQEMGGYLALFIYVLWLARRHLGDIARKALGMKTDASDEEEALPYRAAFFGVVGGIVALSFLCKLAGMSFWVALSVHLLFFVMCVVLTWMVTDGGFFFLLAIFRPSDYLTIPLGTSRIPPRDLTLLAYEKTLMFDLREFMMPHMMNSLKAADAVKVRRRKTIFPMAAAILLGIVTAYIAGVWLWYSKGGLNLGYWPAPEPFQRASRQILAQSDTSWTELGYIGVGTAAMSGLIFLRYRFTWWRLHPLGYAMTTSWAPHTVWFSFFWGWAFKFMILKALGFRGYRRWRPFFLGVVVGDALIGGVWIVVGLFTGVPYRIMPG